MEMSQDQLQELTQIIEDTIEYACDQWMISGEKAWNVAHCLTTAKLCELQGVVSADAV